MDTLQRNEQNPTSSTPPSTQQKQQQQTNSSTISTASQKIQGSGSNTSPRNYETSLYDTTMSGSNTNQHQYNNSSSKDSVSLPSTVLTNLPQSSTGGGGGTDPMQPRLSRQDSISFFTSLANPSSNSTGGNGMGGRFSTDSNSSISQFLSLSGSNGGNNDNNNNNNNNNVNVNGTNSTGGSSFAFDTNGRGLSLINNLFMPPSSTTTSNNNTSNGLVSGPNDYASTYTTLRRPSEQLEPFNATTIRLKTPSYTRPYPTIGTSSTSAVAVGGNLRDPAKFSFSGGSFALPLGSSFNDAVASNNSTTTGSSSGGNDFDFLNKRDSTFRFGSRQPSFLNSDGFDFFRKDSDVGLNGEQNQNQQGQLHGQGSQSGNFTGFETVHEHQEQLNNDNASTNNSKKRRASKKKSAGVTKKNQISSIKLENNPENLHFRQPPLPTYADYQKLPQSQPQQLQSHSPWDANQAPSPTSSDASTATSRFRRNALLPPAPPSGTTHDKSPTYDQPVSPSSQTAAPPTVPSTSVPQLTHIPSKSPQIPVHQQRPATPQQQQNQTQLATPEPTREDGRPLLGATKVDQLMLVIQARKKGIHDQIPQALDGTILENGQGILPPSTELVGGIDKPKTKTTKNHECPYCHKTFTQSTHLEVHIRSHIGYKPFECTYCSKRFTQGGNLRTHLRLHTGEKPYTCEICDRSFSRKGNLAAHKLTHENLKPYECKLDQCGKAFTQLGNLKAHQNRFHLETLNRLTRRLAEIDLASRDIGDEERELLNYFAELYKNSNRGIKGRGKNIQHLQQQHQIQDQVDQGQIQDSTTGQQEYKMGNNNISFKDVDYKN